jgi:tetratricopeptide (TPR) repeat protein
MSEKARGLRTAERLFRAGKYAEVIHHLEPQIFAYRENSRFYELLGYSCLRTGDYGGAQSYLSRSAQLDRDNARALDGLAVAELKRRRPTDAIQTWLDALDVDPGDTWAKRGLNLVRKSENPVALGQELTERELRNLLPPEPRKRRTLRRIALGVTGVALLLGVSFVVARSGVLEELETFTESRGEPRPGEEEVRFNEAPESWLSYEGEFRYVFTAAEAEERFDRAVEYFHDFRDNLARREINRILSSNAADPVKERARLLIDYMQEPDFADFQDNFSYAEVAAEPWLYEGCYVRWRGRVANLEIGDTIRFDLMVGYEDGRVLEGVADVRVPFGVSLDAGESVELIGRVIVGDARVEYLEVASIRRLIGEE